MAPIPDFKLEKEKSILIIIDVQEKLIGTIENASTLVYNITRFINVAHYLNIPIIVTEQYSKGLGPTVEPIRELLKKYDYYNPIDKVIFSCFGVEEFTKRLEELDKRFLIITGIEAHICVNQTVLDAVARGYTVHVPHDAVGSRKEIDKQWALKRFLTVGAVVSSYEMTTYELLRQAKTEEFNKIRPYLF